VHFPKKPSQGHSMHGTRLTTPSTMTSLERRSVETTAGVAIATTANIVTRSVENCILTVMVFCWRLCVSCNAGNDVSNKLCESGQKTYRVVGVV
jgi:adenine C2-methylase RlmN of 23S rRNA A2503 and tRNA A37